ncbi:DUF421 domain-containing protein [Nesterenkonia sphaerica]|uniref:DUF421 domain-containing protein n=1 Tax=Nesterenkonia sphaerica TaxID=1804988 RepID=A0A5R9A9D0_9MICC|nr:YetF domain-containing protein [Nesterenkonia sphaerica]TLP75359.1 DUF421 domain-containing protein [Nesterenkonia sphaerica]
MEISQYWDGWEPIVHTLVTLVAGYLTLLVLLRISGARTMASMTPLDLIIAVTIGSAFGRTVTAVEVPLAQTIFALVLLVLLQWVLAWVRGRSPRIRRLVDSPPVLVYYQGSFQRRAMRKHQLVEDDVHTAVRTSSKGALHEVSAVVLEQNGTLEVIGHDALGDASSVLPYTGAPEST